MNFIIKNYNSFSLVATHFNTKDFILELVCQIIDNFIIQESILFIKFHLGTDSKFVGFNQLIEEDFNCYLKDNFTIDQ